MSLPQKCLARGGWALWLAATAIPCVSLGVEYSASPSVMLQETYNDNIRLINTPTDSVTGSILAPRLNLAARTATWQVGTDMHLRAARYRGIKGLDANSRTVNLFSQIQSERNALQIGGGRARDSILTGEIPDADTGLVKTQTFRITDSANTSWTWSMTEKDQFKLGYQYADVAYKDNVGDLYDYTQRGPNIMLSHRYSERSELYLQVNSSLFDIPKLGASQLGQLSIAVPDGTSIRLLPNPRTLGLESTTNGIQIGTNYAFSQTLSGNLSLGRRKTTTDSLIETCKSSTAPTPGPVPDPNWYGICNRIDANIVATVGRGTVYSLGLIKKAERLQVNTRAERAIDPSGSGVLVQRDTLSLNIERSETERLAYLFSARGDKIRVLEGATIFVDRNQYFIEPGLQWRITRDSRVNLSYQYRYLKYLSETETAHSNMVSLTYTQAWQKSSISR